MNKREFLIKLSVMGVPYSIQLSIAEFIERNDRIPNFSETDRFIEGKSFELERIYQKAFSPEVERAYRKNVEYAGVTTIIDRNYPKALKEIYHPPVVLYFQGDFELANEPALGVVGSRVHSPYAEDSLKLLLPDVINQGIVIVIVSGLAKGTDSIVHQMTMNYCGKTIAVIGTGLDVVYPRGNVMLQNEVAAKGLLLTEYPLGSQPLKFHFPQRNRIIAGLVQTILVVEARHRSGTLITANVALQENRNVLAIPGKITESLSQGTNELIAAGAKPALCSEDIIEEFSNFLTNHIKLP